MLPHPLIPTLCLRHKMIFSFASDTPYLSPEDHSRLFHSSCENSSKEVRMLSHCQGFDPVGIDVGFVTTNIAVGFRLESQSGNVPWPPHVCETDPTSEDATIPVPELVICHYEHILGAHWVHALLLWRLKPHVPSQLSWTLTRFHGGITQKTILNAPSARLQSLWW
jgi:hypothetical protein